jgi:hypothetical protein
MKLSHRLVRPTRTVLAGLLVVAIASLAVGWAAGTAMASSGPRVAAPTSASRAIGAGLGAPGIDVATTLPQPAGGTTSSSGAGVGTGVGVGASIAYPVPGYNSLGVAPEGTIVAQGTGTADMKADGSDKSAALGKATDSALADAHAQALATAAAMGVQLQAVYSVSTASNPSYIYPTPECLIVPLQPGLDGGATGSAGGPAVSPPEICKAQQSTPTSAQLVVTLVVAYKFA